MTSPVTFLKQTQDELKKVTWPKKSEVVRLTGIVLTISVAVGLYIGAIDYVLTYITELLIK